MVAEIGQLLERIDAGDVTRPGGGADIGPLMRAGVPGMGLSVEGSRYFWYHHSDADTIDKLDPREMAEPHIRALEEWAAANDGGVLVAEYAGSLVGFVVFGAEDEFGYHVRPEFRRVGRVSDLYVEPGSREHGVGRADLVEPVRTLRTFVGTNSSPWTGCTSAVRK